MKLAENIAVWIQQQVVAAGAQGLVVGLSGGMDSAVVARLCQLASPDAALGVLMPCVSDPADAEDARLVAGHFGLPVIYVALDETYGSLIDALRTATDAVPSFAEVANDASRTRISLANIKARLRMTTLYFVANALNYLVAGTGNRSEIAVGYFTKHGDGGCDLLPLGNLLKTQVASLACELDVPPAILDKAPSAGLWSGQTDQEDLGFSYEHLDSYFRRGPEGVAPALALRVERLMRASEHKRMRPALPPSFDE